MAQHPIEIILLKQLARYLAVPIWIAGPDGTLLYYNEPAEDILGIRFDEAGELPVDILAERFVTTDLDGSTLSTADLPIAIALGKQQPAHRSMRIRGLDGSWRTIGVTSLPIVGQGDRLLGAMATFWEEDS